MKQSFKEPLKSLTVIILLIATILFLAFPEFNESPAEATNQSFQAACPYTTVHYDISGVNLADLRAEMLAKGPVDSMGVKRFSMVSWKLAWSWDTQADGSPELEDAALNPQIVLTLPRWANQITAAPSEIAQWQSIMDAITKHENNHINHACQAMLEAQDIIRTSAEESPLPSAKVVNEKIESSVWRYRSADIEYDEKTENGRREGVVIAQRS